MLQHQLLRQIPKMDELLTHPLLDEFYGTTLVKKSAQNVLDDVRNKIRTGQMEDLPSINALASKTLEIVRKTQQPNLRRVVNGTGIILHTNLGRAPLAASALQNILNTASSYSNLEYNTTDGTRGSRHKHVESLFTDLTGAEAAMIVNNNAAAVLLAVASLANKKEVVVSRGELVEIGGSFRIPEVITQSGCSLVEIGTTNKTHLSDYEMVINPLRTGAVLRVHTSNFSITGFVSKPSLSDLVKLANDNGIPLIEDLGSGCLIPLTQFGIHSQPIVADSIKEGVDVVMFSGDKLLGGPQAGIIVGKAELIAKMKAHPLARAVRIDKLSIATLEATLRLYTDSKTVVSKVPVLQMLCTSVEETTAKARRLKHLLEECNIGKINIVIENSKAGGGAMPDEELPSAAVSIEVSGMSACQIHDHFRLYDTPIIGRITKDRFLLNTRTIYEEEFTIILDAFKRIPYTDREVPI